VPIGCERFDPVGVDAKLLDDVDGVQPAPEALEDLSRKRARAVWWLGELRASDPYQDRFDVLFDKVACAPWTEARLEGLALHAPYGALTQPQSARHIPALQ